MVLIATDTHGALGGPPTPSFLHEMRAEHKQIRKVLRNMVPTATWTSGRMGLSGSSAMQMYEYARYSDAILLERPAYICGDADIFYCCNDEEFALTKAIIQLRLCRKGYKTSYETTFVHRYIHPDYSIWIWEFKLEAIDIKFSLVQAPQEISVEEVVDRFDIDIVKVIYDPGRDRFIVEPSVVRAIDNRTFRAKDFVFDREVPSKFELIKTVRTYKRIQKYMGRGYRLVRMPQIKCRTSSSGTGPIRDFPIELEMDPLAVVRTSRGEIFNDQVRINRFLKRHFPPLYIYLNRVGIVGDCPLAWYMANRECAMHSAGVRIWKPQKVHVVLCGRLVRDGKELSLPEYLESRFRMAPGELALHHGCTPVRNCNDYVAHTVRGIRARFVFMHCPEAVCVNDVLGQIALPCMRMMFDLWHGRLYGHPGIQRCIHSGNIVVRNPLASAQVLSDDDIRHFQYLFGYVQYYTIRGFAFVQNVYTTK